MNSSSFPIIVDGPNFINRILDMNIDKDIISEQLSFVDFRVLINNKLEEANFKNDFSGVDFVCSQKLFGNKDNKFTQIDRDKMLNWLCHEKGFHVELINLPGHSEKGVDNFITVRMETLAKTFKNIILISEDLDYVPVLKKMREQGTNIFLFSISNTPPIELVNESFFTLKLDNYYPWLFKYYYPRYSLANNFTKGQLREIIANGDDRIHNQLRIEQNGLVYLSHKAIGADQLHNVLFRFETLCPYNDYVGPKAASDKKYVDDEYENLMLGWQHKDELPSYLELPAKTYIKTKNR